MHPRERMIRQLENKGELPDRVPTFVEGMMTDFKRKCDDIYEDQISDELLDFSFSEGVGVNYLWPLFFEFDSLWLHSSPVQMKKLDNIDLQLINEKLCKESGEEQRIGRWGHITQKTHDRYTGDANGYLTGYLNTKELWNEWIDAGYFEFEVSNDWIRQWEKNYPKFLEYKDGLVLVPVDTIFEKVREAFTFGKFSYFLRKEKDFLKILIDKIFKVGMAFAKGVCDAGFEIITFADDTAYKNRVMYSPKLFEELIVPKYKELNDYIHKRGLLSFYHSDGYTEPFFPGLIKAGFDGTQSLEPLAGMDIEQLKKDYGDQVCLIGNLDCSQLLPYGSTEDIYAEVKHCIDVAAGGGGFILGPCTDIIDSIKPENIKAMVEANKKYGWYEK